MMICASCLSSCRAEMARFTSRRQSTEKLCAGHLRAMKKHHVLFYCFLNDVLNHGCSGWSTESDLIWLMKQRSWSLLYKIIFYNQAFKNETESDSSSAYPLSKQMGLRY